MWYTVCIYCIYYIWMSLWMSHYTHMHTVYHMNVMPHIWISHIWRKSWCSRFFFVSKKESHVTREWIMTHIWVRHVRYSIWLERWCSKKNTSTELHLEWRTCEYGVWHIWREYGCSCKTFTISSRKWVMSHVWRFRGVRHVTHVNESCHTYEWVTSHMWISPVTHVDKSYHTYEWVMSHLWMGHVIHMNGPCHTYE